MNKTAYEMVKGPLSVTQLMGEALHHLYLWQRVLSREGQGNDDDENRLREAFGVIHGRIVERELGAWRSVALMALALDAEQQREVKALAYRRFFHEGASVMYLTDAMGEQPTSWRSGEEDELRAWLRDHFLGTAPLPQEG